MARTYQPKYLPDGSENPKYYKRKPRTPEARERERQRLKKRDASRIRTKPGARKTRWERREIIAIDGEGRTLPDGRHIYTLLAAADSERAWVLAESPDGLTTDDCLRALLDVFVERPNAIVVAFASGYDVNMMLGDLPRETVQRLWETGRCIYTLDGHTVRISYTPQKSFSLTRLMGRRTEGGTLWDTFGFYQQSFVKALEAFRVGSVEELAAIHGMKLQRSTFGKDSAEAVRHYCLDECRKLVELTLKLFDAIDGAGIQLRRYDGAGAVSGALLRRQGVLDHKSDTMPLAATIASQYAYFGGRIECLRYGHAPDVPVFGYDINSAYPDAMSYLPSLAGARWERHKRPPGRQRTFSMYRVRFRFPRGRALYPFPWRADDGGVYFPRQGEGWYWEPEVRAAMEHEPNGIEILDAWTCHPATDVRPFAWMPELYAARQALKREGNAAEKAVKLGINGAYGKLAQRVGGRNGEPPTWNELSWAGWITSYTRSRLYLAAMQAPDDAIMLATDAIYSTAPLRLELGSELGEWGLSEYDGITSVKSGVYRLYVDGRTEDCYRGYDANSIDWGRVVRGWQRGQLHVRAASSRFVGMGLALGSDSQWQRWRRWVTDTRLVSLTPAGTKRQDVPGRRAPHKGLVPTLPADVRALQRKDPLSRPTELPWSPLAGPSARELDTSARALADSEG